MKVPRFVLYIAVIIPTVLIAAYAWNPLGVPSWDPRGRIFGVIPYRNPSTSMAPTLPMGSYFVACTASYSHAKPLAGDIIVFWSPPTPNIPFVKRIVAVGGDSVELIDGKLLLNGSPQDEKYLQSEPSYPYMTRTEVPMGSVFVMGDNRDNSYDSRQFGPVPLASIIGKVCAQ